MIKQNKKSVQADCPQLSQEVISVVAPLAETHVMLTAWMLVFELTALVALALVLSTGLKLGRKKRL